MIIFNVTTPYTKAFCKIVNVNSMHKALEIEKSVTRINFLKSQLQSLSMSVCIHITYYQVYNVTCGHTF